MDRNTDSLHRSQLIDLLNHFVVLESRSIGLQIIFDACRNSLRDRYKGFLPTEKYIFNSVKRDLNGL